VSFLLPCEARHTRRLRDLTALLQFDSKWHHAYPDSEVPRRFPPLRGSDCWLQDNRHGEYIPPVSKTVVDCVLQINGYFVRHLCLISDTENGAKMTREAGLIDSLTLLCFNGKI